MKLYIFLKIGDAKGVYDNPIIYAFTNKKELANEFRKTRNMEMFIEKTTDVSREAYGRFSVDHKGHMLVESGFVTKSDNTLTGRKTVNIVTTQYEEETVYIHADRVLIELGKYTAFESSLLNNDIIENLDMLKYFDIFKFYSPDSQVYHSMVPSDIDLSVDYLSLFIYFYGNTMAIQK